MAKHPAKASTEQVKGSLKEAIGKLTGNIPVEAEDKAKKKLLRSDRKTEPTRRS